MATTLSSPVSPAPRESLQRPRTASAMSYVSNRSRRSSGSGKADLSETTKDKKRLNTKADPSRAITEAQPAAVALEDSNLENLRQIQHKDVEGNLIADPDRSNPTRHRLERPLDTIRSFQAAAEGTSHSRRSSYQSRPPSQIGFDTTPNRRSSYYSGQGFSPSPQRPRPSNGGYYRNSSYGFRPDSFIEEPVGSDVAPQNGYHSNNQNGHQSPGRAQPTRYVSAPSYYNQAATGASPPHSHQQSYETMTSGSEETNNKSTNPSSQNSSFDHLQQVRKPEEFNSEYNSHFAPVQAPQPTGFMYNANGVVQPQAGPNYGSSPPTNGFNYPQRQQQQPGSMGPPTFSPNNPRVPIKLNGGASGSNDYGFAELEQSPSKKRGSWLKRAFSKKDK